MSFNSSTRRHPRQSESGYILLTLLLIVALMTIFAATLVTSITFSIKRDREEEMIHRGTQYSRAIRAYYKKFGRYPTKIEDLESANNMRFLRKRYKDPITGKDFKLLHFGEVKLTLSGMTGTSMIPGASPVGGAGNSERPGRTRARRWSGTDLLLRCEQRLRGQLEFLVRSEPGVRAESADDQQPGDWIGSDAGRDDSARIDATWSRDFTG